LIILSSSFSRKRQILLLQISGHLDLNQVDYFTEFENWRRKVRIVHVLLLVCGQNGDKPKRRQHFVF